MRPLKDHITKIEKRGKSSKSKTMKTNA